MAVSNSSKKFVEASGSYASLIGTIFSRSAFIENSSIFNFWGIDETKPLGNLEVLKPFKIRDKCWLSHTVSHVFTVSEIPDSSISASCQKMIAALTKFGCVPNNFPSPFVTRLLFSLICSYGVFSLAPPSIIRLLEVHGPFSRARIVPPQFLNSRIRKPPLVMRRASNSTPSIL